jgi:hypothetical protein
MKAGFRVIDLFAIALTHGLIAIACWRILRRPDLDVAGEGGQAQTGRAKRGDKRRRA